LVGPGNRRRGSQIGHLRPRPAGIRLVLARRAPPAVLPEPGRHAARCHPQDGDGEVVWAAYRNSGGVDIPDDLQLIYDIGGAKRVAVLNDSTIGGGPNLWKVEYDLDGTFHSGQQLGTSAEPKFSGKLCYSYDIFPTVVRYYVAGQTTVGGNSLMFLVATDGSGNNLWGKYYTGLTLRPNFLFADDSGKLFAGGNVDKAGQTKLGLAKISTGGTDLGLRLYGNSSHGVQLTAEQSTDQGMILVGEGYNSTLTSSDDSMPLPVSFYHGFQNFAGSGASLDLVTVDKVAVQTNDVTATAVLNSGGGGFDCLITSRNPF